MNKLQISGNGFPGTNKTWRFLQQALGDAISGIAGVLGDKVILSGVEVIGSNVSDGIIIYNGEVFPFEGGLLDQDVTIMETIENVDYKIDVNNDNLFDNLPAYITKVAKCGIGGVATFPFADLVRLTRLQDVFDGDYNHLQNLPTLPVQATQSVAGIMRLASISEVIEGVNNENAVTPMLLKQYINVLTKGSYFFGDVVTDTEKTVYLYPTLPHSNYMVLGSFRGSSAGGGNRDNDVMWVTTNHQIDSFKLWVREVSEEFQNLWFNYLIIGF